MYDDIADLYHLIYPDWNAAIRQQAEKLSGVIQSHWKGDVRNVLDASCGIGTQAIGLAALGYRVTASDPSIRSVERAEQEAAARGVEVAWHTGDMRASASAHGAGVFDLVVSADNSIPHLLDDDEIRSALVELNTCLRPGGGCLLTMRDYDAEERGRGIVQIHGVREHNGERWIVFQVRDFAGDHYDVSVYFVRDSDPPGVRVGHSRYYAVSPERVMTLMREVGFESVQRLDGILHQPVLLGTRPSTP